jgi:hypothetical protein
VVLRQAVVLVCAGSLCRWRSGDRLKQTVSIFFLSIFMTTPAFISEHTSREGKRTWPHSISAQNYPTWFSGFPTTPDVFAAPSHPVFHHRLEPSDLVLWFPNYSRYIYRPLSPRLLPPSRTIRPGSLVSQLHLMCFSHSRKRT